MIIKLLVEELRLNLDAAKLVAGATGNEGVLNNVRLYGEAADAIEKLSRDLKDCRNELCLRCGDYKMRHKGACDGCRWKE